MVAGTHIAFAGFCAVIAQGFGLTITPECAAAVVIGSLIPDIDTTASGLGKFMKPISRFIESRVGHRTLTHSLLGLALFGLLAAPIWYSNPKAWIFFVIGIASHLALDTLNIIGVPLLYPSRLQFWFVHNRNYRIPYGSPLESSMALVCALLALCLYPLSNEGFTPAFHRWLGTPAGVVADYLEWRDTSEVWAVVDGFNTQTQERIKGRYRVVDAIGREGIIIEDEQGHGLGVGMAQGSQISTFHIHAQRGRPIISKEYRLEVSGRTVADLLSSLPATNRVWITANLQTSERQTPAPPKVGFYPKIKGFALQLEVRSAHKSDFVGLETAFIQRGTAIIRSEFIEGETPPSTLEFASGQSRKTHVLEIPNLPSASGLVVKIGDRVLEGQPIARYVNDAAITAFEDKVKSAKVSLQGSQRNLEMVKNAFLVLKPKLENSIKSAQEELKRIEFLVGAGAEPAVKLALARDKLRLVENTRLLELSRLTSEQNRVADTIKRLELEVKSADSQKLEVLGKQWVKSPFNALISDVKLKSVTAKGVTLEVVLLELPEAKPTGGI